MVWNLDSEYTPRGVLDFTLSYVLSLTAYSMALDFIGLTGLLARNPSMTGRKMPLKSVFKKLGGILALWSCQMDRC